MIEIDSSVEIFTRGTFHVCPGERLVTLPRDQCNTWLSETGEDVDSCLS